MRAPCRVHKTSPVENCLECAGLTGQLRPNNKVLLAQLTAQPTEHKEQAEVFRWAALPETLAAFPELEELFAVPNFLGHAGKKTSRLAAARKANAEGRKKGVEDVFLLVARGGYHGLCIEVKRTLGVPSDVAPEQKIWHKRHTMRGYKVAVCFGAERVKETLVWYLSQPKTKAAA
jgi:hypothetical protein